MQVRRNEFAGRPLAEEVPQLRRPFLRRAAARRRTLPTITAASWCSSEMRRLRRRRRRLERTLRIVHPQSTKHADRARPFHRLRALLLRLRRRQRSAEAGRRKAPRCIERVVVVRPGAAEEGARGAVALPRRGSVFAAEEGGERFGALAFVVEGGRAPEGEPVFAGWVVRRGVTDGEELGFGERGSCGDEFPVVRRDG
jgi:hypothetical protein